MTETVLPEHADAEAPLGWANGVTIKRTRDGYSWSIAVAADSNDLGAMGDAIATAVHIDGELTAIYGPPKGARPRQRVYPPPRFDGRGDGREEP
jgi:hypothetical protein